ncbi:MAG: hypothetical protein ABL997_04465 [Planctomycetota bacterium]
MTYSLRHLFVLVLLTGIAAPVGAQVPADSVLVLELVPVQPVDPPPAFRLVDILGRGNAVVRGQSVFSPMSAVAVDPVDGSRVYFETNGSSIPGTWTTSIRGLARLGINSWGSLGRDAADRLEAGSTQVFTLRNSQLFAVPKNGGTNTPIAAVPGAVDLVVVDPEVFVLTVAPGPASQILAVHASTRAVRTVGTYPAGRALAWSPTFELLLGTDSGAILRIDATSGAVTNTTTTATTFITGIAATRFGTAVWTDGAQIYSEILGGASIYTSATSILDLAAPRSTEPSLMPYGTSCARPDTVAFQFDTQPALGNAAFRVGLRRGAPNTNALLCIGPGFSFSTLFGQPLPVPLQGLGLGQCLLWSDPIVQAGVPLDAVGSADVSIGIPNDPALVGATFGLQWFGAQSGANALSLVGSEGAAAQIY